MPHHATVRPHKEEKSTTNVKSMWDLEFFTSLIYIYIYIYIYVCVCVCVCVYWRYFVSKEKKIIFSDGLWLVLVATK